MGIHYRRKFKNGISKHHLSYLESCPQNRKLDTNRKTSRTLNKRLRQNSPKFFIYLVKKCQKGRIKHAIDTEAIFFHIT